MKYKKPTIQDLFAARDGKADDPGCNLGNTPVTPDPDCQSGICNIYGCSPGTDPGVQRAGACVSGNEPDVAVCCSGTGPWICGGGDPI